MATKNKVNFKYLRQLVEDAKRKDRTDYCTAARAEYNKQIKAAATKASKDTLVSIVIGEKCVNNYFGISYYDIYNDMLNKAHSKHNEILKKLEALELQQALGEDPSAELKKIADAISKL